ncbi:MAG: MotA/TolQ/ExbB proton channel family protein [Deltaproteobacteria bacterium]|nr:MotA/TolQ/ExbB proton channel family protein [Deltaproteobacteria bacterium]
MLLSQGLVATLISLPIFEAEWVLWLLIALSIVSVSIMVERLVFYRRHAVDVDAVRTKLADHLTRGEFKAATEYLSQYDSLETNIALFGLRAHEKGADAVASLVEGALPRERIRYSERLGFLASVGSNAPFIGLFGTVLGIIRAFKDLSASMTNAGGTVMAGIAEALIATAIGLMVAIPAVIAYNVFTARVKKHAANAELLAKTLLAQLKSGERGPNTATTAPGA